MALSQLLRNSLFALATVSVPVLAQDSDVTALDGLLGDIQTLSADVLQLIVESDGGVLEESEIKMQLKKPDGFYWETVQPFPELIVTNGVKLWNYQPDLDQVVVEDWNTDQSELAAQLLSGRTHNLQQEYTIEQVGSVESTRADFNLTPIAPDNLYESIKIRFLESNLESITMNSKSGERTVWTFAKVVKNQSIDDAVFVFEPPAGIEVIENSYNQ